MVLHKNLEKHTKALNSNNKKLTLDEFSESVTNYIIKVYIWKIKKKQFLIVSFFKFIK